MSDDNIHLSGEMADEMAELVTRPVNEALAPVPFREAPAGARTQTSLPDGYTRYQSGKFFVDVSPLGLITVRQDDWLSKFSAAIDDTTAVEGRFARVDGNALVPIADENFIDTGELLVYLPTYRARLSEQDGLKLRIGDRDVPLPKPSGKDIKTTVEDLLRAGELQRESETGEIADRTMEKLRTGDLEKAFSENQDFFGIAAGSVKGLGREAFVRSAIEVLKGTLLAENPDLESLREDEDRKKLIFTNDARKTVAILYYEFITGSGPHLREFDENDEITRDIRDGHIGDVISAEIGRRYALAAARSPMRAAADGSDVGLAPIDFGSFHDSFGFGAERAIATMEDVRDRAADPIEAFLGSYRYEVDTSDNRIGKRGVEYAVTVSNDTSLESLFAHGPTVRNLPRPSELEQALADVSKTLPYSTTTQHIKFYSPLPLSVLPAR